MNNTNNEMMTRLSKSCLTETIAALKLEIQREQDKIKVAEEVIRNAKLCTSNKFTKWFDILVGDNDDIIDSAMAMIVGMEEEIACLEQQLNN